MKDFPANNKFYARRVGYKNATTEWKVVDIFYLVSHCNGIAKHEHAIGASENW